MWMVTSISVAVAGQRFVDGVIDDFVDQVVQAHFAGRADIHGGAQAHRLQTFQHFDTAWNRKLRPSAGIHFIGHCHSSCFWTVRSALAQIRIGMTT